MKLLKELSINLIIGLNALILFLLVFETQIEIPEILRVAGRTHPLLLHFPIVVLLLAFVLKFFEKYFSIEEAAFRKIVRFLLFAGALTSAATVILGLFLSQEEGYSGDLLQWHKWIGVAVSFISCGLLWGFQENISSKFLKTGMAISSIAVLVAGHFGASLTHGEDFILAPLSSGAADENFVDLTQAVVYNDLVRPVLKEKCYSCHNPDKAKGQLVMTDLDALLKGGKTGKLFVAGNSDESLIMERLLLDVNHKHRMPPKGKAPLTEEETALIRIWIDQGASFSAKLSDYASGDEIHQIVKSMYAGGPAPEVYDFEAADETRVNNLNTVYRLVSPIAYESPGLEVTFFSKSNFDTKSFEEIKPVANQIVYLNLSGMNVTDTEMKLIAGFPNLRQLNVNYSEVTDKGLKELSTLKHLNSIMVAGTKVSVGGITSLTGLPNLKRIYAWNTGINSADSKSLAKKYPGVLVDTGALETDKDTLTLNNPQFLPKNAFFRESFQLTIKHPIHGVDLIYTVGGSNPDSVQPKKYEKPIFIKENTIVKAKAEKGGWISSKVVEKNYQRSSIKPDVFSLKTTPAPQHKGRGGASLFDLIEGSTDILYASDGNWLGYSNQDFIVEMGFKKPVVLKEVLLSTLTSTALESFPPSEIEIWVAYGGAPLSLAGRIKIDMPGEKSPIERKIIACPTVNNQAVTSLKIIAKPLSKLPSWHKNKGKAAWFFLDEILIN